MYQLGLKLWSNNSNYIEEAIKLYEQGIYHYIELYTVPDTYNQFIDLWSNLNIPYTIHAPHSIGGLNLSRKEYREKNINMSQEVIKFADKLKAETIIFHPGVAGDIEETVFQLNKINDRRIIIENKPYYALIDGLVCNGNSPEEIRYIIDNAKVGFCLDIGHSICSANAHKIEPFVYLKQFMKLRPEIFHLTDGDYSGLYDRHEHFSDGNFPLKEILNILPDASFITIETLKSSQNNLNDFLRDINLLKSIEKDDDTE